MSTENKAENKAVDPSTLTTAEKRVETVKKFRKHETDTGSPQVQIALLTERITHINAHLQKARKDHAGRRGLVLMVGQRNRLLKYMGRTDREGYQKLIATLGLRK